MVDTTTFSPRFNYAPLRGKIREVFGTEGAFAKELGRSQNYLSKVWKGGTYFGANDISNGAEALGIPVEEIGFYFFTH